MGSDFAVGNFFSYLNSDFALNEDLGSNHVYIIDKELMQRGRLDDRSKQELNKALPSYPLYSYDCIEVADIKNKMSEDMRILFTEYRQKRKGNFDSNSRRASDLKINMKSKANYSYVGVAFIVLVFGILFIPKIVNRFNEGDIIRNDESRSNGISSQNNKKLSDLSFIEINGVAKKVPEFSFTNQYGKTISNTDLPR